MSRTAVGEERPAVLAEEEEYADVGIVEKGAGPTLFCEDRR